MTVGGHPITTVIGIVAAVIFVVGITGWCCWMIWDWGRAMKEWRDR